MAHSKKDIMDLEDYQEDDFQSLLEEHDNRQSKGSVIDGVIVDIREDIGEVCVDIGEKEEATLPISEIQVDGNLIFKKGDTIRVALLGNRGSKSKISYQKALRKAKIEEFINNFKDEDKENIIEVEIISKNAGGYVAIDSNGVEFFLPRSQYISIKDNKNFKQKKLKVKIIKIDKDECSIVVSRKKVSEEERKKKRELVKGIMD